MGESILICSENNSRIGIDLLNADLKPIESCLEVDNNVKKMNQLKQGE